MATDEQLALSTFEQARHGYLPRWRYVSGGRVLHAFFSDQDTPVCGISPTRGDPPRPCPWVSPRRAVWSGWSGYRREHGVCLHLVAARQAEIRQHIPRVPE